MRGKVESEKKGWNSTLYNKQWRKKNRKQWRNIERISKVLWKFTTNKTTRKPAGKKIEPDINIIFQKIIDDEHNVERKKNTARGEKSNPENEK